MRMGEMQVPLWRGFGKEGEEWYPPSPCAPACSNPDPKAVTLTVKFDSYGYPVYYPSTTPQSWTCLLGLNESNAALHKQFLRLLDLIKEGKLHGVSHAHKSHPKPHPLTTRRVDSPSLSPSLPPLSLQALPTYIEKLEWGNLSKTLEVYSLLTELMKAKNFPVEVWPSCG